MPAHDVTNVIDWGKASGDYSTFRPAPSFYARLAVLGVGLPGQSILDLGTGTGVLARQRAIVTGVDVSEEQIMAAGQLAAGENWMWNSLLAVLENAKFDMATANQARLYFDCEKTVDELRRDLRQGGWLVTSHFSWLPRLDSIARQTEELVLKFNPHWSAADWHGMVPPCPKAAENVFDVRAMLFYDDQLNSRERLGAAVFERVAGSGRR